MKSSIFFLWAVMVLGFSLLPRLTTAQQKLSLKSQDYALWDKSSRIAECQTSPNGQWLYYVIKNTLGDSVFVRNTKSGRTHTVSVSNAVEHPNHFDERGDRVAIHDNDSVAIIHLPSGKTQWFTGTGGSFVPRSNRVLLIEKDSSSSRVVIQDLKTGERRWFDHVKTFEVNSDVSAVAIISDSAGIATASVVNLTGAITVKKLCSIKGVSFTSLTWNKSGKVLAFIEKPSEASTTIVSHQFYVCDMAGNQVKISRFTPADSITVTTQKAGPINSMHLSEDGQQLFFKVTETKYMTGNDALPDTAFKPVRIWGAADPVLPPAETAYNSSFWYAWHANGRIEQLTDSVYPFFFFNGDQQQLIVYHKRDYLPRHQYVHVLMDMYIKNRETGETRLLVKKVKDYPYEFLASPGGRYIAYFKENNWWSYDFKTNVHRCLTRNLGINWETTKSGSTGMLPPYGTPGWLENDQSLIVYDEFDIWLINPDGTNARKITNGRKDEITFRVVDNELRRSGPGEGNPWFNSKSLDGRKGIQISSLHYRTMDNGLWWWTASKELSKIMVKNKRIDERGNQEYGKPLMLIESDFDVPPRLVVQHPSGKDELLYQTNPQQANFQWGKPRVIRYRVPGGKELSGALLFPANYDSTKKYPMVVEIYEKRAKEVHYYIEPSVSTNKSNYVINPTVYTNEGYFVLFPDITYRLNEPGIAASECIIAAVQAAVAGYGVDQNRIGLTGHSFGGYETAFTLTQTNIFKTAIAGAGITDLPDFYLGISIYGTNFTRVEEDQFRMQVPFYSEAFARNSPMHNIEKINAPLLLYTGQEDGNVDWTQSRRLQTALWRLGKKSTMLAYPGEDHVVMKEVNQVDLATRMKEWFDYYLKDEKPAAWIKSSMGIN